MMAQSKAKGKSRTSKPRKPAAGTKSPPKGSVKAKPVAQAKRATGKPATRRDQIDWRGQTLERMRALILKADPEMIEEQKWRKPSNAMAGVPVWSHDGIVCTGETYKQVVKLTFAKGASLRDPTRLFNSSLEGN